MPDDGAASRAPQSVELTSQGAGTYWYLPPECFRTDVVGGPRVSGRAATKLRGAFKVLCS